MVRLNWYTLLKPFWETGNPLTITSPRVGLSAQKRILRSVVFPEPLEPAM
jgi:hypothetical protein